MNITRGQTITIHPWNNGSVAHGFAITHNFDQGVVLLPGQSCDLTFSASQAGTFSVYSTEPDPTFELAQLNVNP